MDYKSNLEQVSSALESIQKIDTSSLSQQEQLRLLIDEARIAKIVADTSASIDDAKVKAEVEKKKLSQEALRTELDRDRLKLDEEKLTFEKAKLDKNQELETRKFEFEQVKLDKDQEVELRKISLDEQKFEFEKNKFYREKDLREKELKAQVDIEHERAKTEMKKMILGVVGSVFSGILNIAMFGATYRLAMSTIHLERFENGRPMLPVKEEYSDLKRFFKKF